MYKQLSLVNRADEVKVKIIHKIIAFIASYEEIIF